LQKSYPKQAETIGKIIRGRTAAEPVSDRNDKHDMS